MIQAMPKYASGRSVPGSSSDGFCSDYLLLALGNAADKQPAVVDGHADSEEATASYLVVVHLGHGSARVLAARVGHEAVAAVGAAEVHHQAELVDAAAAFERRHQLVLVTVARDLADEDLTAAGRCRARPARRRTVLPLTILLGHTVYRHGSVTTTVVKKSSY